jgi:aminopeptidase YwaD
MFSTLIASAVLAFSSAPGVSIQPGTIQKHVEFLASKELAGRMTLREGERKAAAYIAAEFKRLGLDAREKGGGYIHEYELSIGYRVTKNNMAVITGLDGTKLTLELERDFVPLVGSAVRIVNAPMVWVGYGNDEDYANVDVAGKVVLMFRGAQDGRGRTNAQKARTAKEKGAVGVVLIGPSTDGRAELPAVSRGQGMSDSTDIAGIAIHQKFFKQLVGSEFAEARKATGVQSKQLTSSIRFVAEAEVNKGMATNVIGYLPGKDPKLKNEYIIIGGHFDHLGLGETGSRTGTDMIHYGADDNGSGTAGVMAAAEWYAKNGGNRRTIIFQCYSGEELGLRGSNAWAGDHAELLKSVSVMLNMDMIGGVRFDQTFVFGLSSSTELLPVFSNVNVSGLRLLLYPHTRGDSDQGSFIRRNVPALFFHTGLTDVYHTEKDTVDLVNFPGAAKVVEAVIQTAQAIDALPNKLPWNPETQTGGRPNDRQLPTGPMESPLKPPAKSGGR